MARRKRTPGENTRCEKIRELLQLANVGSMDDIQELFKDTIAEFMEAGLDDQLSYSRYDYKNKDTDNSRNGHSSKTLRTSFGDVEVSVPRDRKSEFDPKVLRKNQTGISRGVEDIFIACTDNLTGFSAAIEAVYPKTEIQNCIIHQLRNSSKYVSYKDLKALMADLKAVYAAVDEPAALDALDTFAEHWDKKYPKISQSWRDNWANLSTYFKFPQELRRLIYTTNTIEGFNRQLRKVTKAKSVFPTDDSLFKMLYLAMIDITKKWTGRRQDWSMIHAQLAIYFEDRMPG